jgi:hypothetical protein
MRPKRQPKSGVRSNKPLVIVFAACSLLALGITVYKEFRILEPVRSVLPVLSETLVICVPSGEGRLIQKQMGIKTGMSDVAKAGIIMAELRREKVIPEAVTLTDFVAGDEDTLYLNFSKEIRDTRLTSMEEVMMGYAIVDSFLATFKTMKRVQLLVEDRPVYTLNGAMYTLMPLESNKELLEE